MIMSATIPDTHVTRYVGGLAFKPCTYCGRSQTHTATGKSYNYQYADGRGWDPNVYCSRACQKAWHTENQK